MVLHTAAVGFAAILVISGHVASAQADPVEIPLELANKLRPAVTGEGALDTPFFNAAEEEITIASLKGRGVVLNFWATWCAPCVREMPALDRLAAALKDQGVDVIAVSEDRKALKKVPPFFEANAIANLDVYYDLKGQLSRKVGVEGLPTTVLIDAEGQLVGRVLGVLEWDAPQTVNYLAQTLTTQKP
ncbi:TlpA disulfide reductase family protein [Magnetovibrio sp.]|uniref:TlpA disulfide reductase family protein n=1 Tax=Magnetovibrio sp. TaxID=2024836 RepID=UPI002F942BC1